MKTVQFSFNGMMVPVFTPFNDDKQRSINFEVIEKYAQYLKQHGMNGVLVNGMTGEGMTLRVEERKMLAEAWMKAARKNSLTMVLNIGGAAIADVYEMAIHAEQLAVDAVLVLPDLFYKPQNEEDLVMYMADIAQRMPTRPMLYYHMPMMTATHMHMWRLAELAEKDIPSFNGFMFADGNLDKAVAAMKQGRTIIMGMGMMMIGALAQGMEAISMTAMNLYPEMMAEVWEHMHNNRLQDAKVAQQKMMQRINNVVAPGNDLLAFMKMEFNKMYSNMKMGPMRKPKMSMMMQRM